MALTRAFSELMRERAERDPAFRDALRREGIDINWNKQSAETARTQVAEDLHIEQQSFFAS